jgi:serine/threonine protein kinase
VRSGIYSKKPLEERNVSEKCIEFIDRLLKVNPKERYSCSEALRDDWFLFLRSNILALNEQEAKLKMKFLFAFRIS